MSVTIMPPNTTKSPHSPINGDGSTTESITVKDSTSSVSDSDSFVDVFEQNLLSPSRLPTPIPLPRITPTPYIQEANDLLFSHKKARIKILRALDFAENLCISKSDVAENAGNGLYIVAKKSDLQLKKGHVITWFNGKVEYYNPDDERQLDSMCYTVPLGSSFRNASQIILTNPQDYNLKGCGQFANHSKKPNATLSYVQGETSVIGVTLILNKDTLIRQGYALEIVFNYGQSSYTVHHLPSENNYSPQPKPIHTLQDIKAPENMIKAKPEKRKSIALEETPISPNTQAIRFFQEFEAMIRDSQPLFYAKPFM